MRHDKDHFNSPKDYELFSNLSSIKFVNLTESGCKKKKTLDVNKFGSNHISISKNSLTLI